MKWEKKKNGEEINEVGVLKKKERNRSSVLGG